MKQKSKEQNNLYSLQSDYCSSFLSSALLLSPQFGDVHAENRGV